MDAATNIIDSTIWTVLRFLYVASTLPLSVFRSGTNKPSLESANTSIGLLIFLNGVLDLPKGKIKIDNANITVSGVKDKMDQGQLRNIQITSEMLLVTDVNNQFVKVDNLVIDRKTSILIEKYILNNRTNQELRVTNKVS